ncbi:SDR family oxidoreductase [Lacimonas salitolerans]|uniref:SDR family oxidoreductase n=1 Tax=Lacimonas salitolerans TaxID=1323750 RepID=A0ABW4EG04_9RHOB
MEKTLFSFGHGYSAQALAHRLLAEGWRVYGTTRNPGKIKALKDQGVHPLLWGHDDIPSALAQATHLLSSVSPDADGDPVLAEYRAAITAAAPQIAWVGYLSTTGVYGDRQGGWVDESSPLTPGTRRGQARVDAERAWAAIPGLPLHIFRLAGIYGPGRGPFEKVRQGTAQRIIKPGQVFSRTHVEDIAQVLAASIARPDPGAVYNVCDDDPAPPQDVIAHAADLLDLPLPPAVDFNNADLSPMARSFYSESKRVSNDRIKQDLGVTLLYPSYREGLRAILKAEV